MEMKSRNRLDLSNTQELIRQRETFFNPVTRFCFLNDHYGLRPGKIHCLLASAGKGKSTLCRSILIDCAKEIPCVLYATEESKSDLEEQFAINKVRQEDVDNIYLMHESLDLPKNLKRVESWIDKIRKVVQETGAKVFFFDNITSSRLYNNYENQTEMVLQLKALAEELEIAIFIVCHTKKGIKNNEWFKEDDVKGSTQLSITAEFFYAYNMFIVSGRGESDAKHAFIRILKCRGYANTAFSYDLQFDFNTYSYLGDRRVRSRDLEKVAKESSKVL